MIGNNPNWQTRGYGCEGYEQNMQIADSTEG